MGLRLAIRAALAAALAAVPAFVCERCGPFGWLQTLAGTAIVAAAVYVIVQVAIGRWRLV
jgi:hypothetical protein